jgi:predicted DNA-binding protein (UPF0251 family)
VDNKESMHHSVHTFQLEHYVKKAIINLNIRRECLSLPRPKKWRKVGFVPSTKYYAPIEFEDASLDENILKIEEIEAIRLKDLLKFEQEECAKKMEVSRQTFQRILNKAREKIANSLINGKAIRIQGGNFTKNICSAICKECETTWTHCYENFNENEERSCPKCGSLTVECMGNDQEESFCKGKCKKHGKRKKTK